MIELLKYLRANGFKTYIFPPDVWCQIGENLSRQPQKASVLDIFAPDGRGAASDAAADPRTSRSARINRRYPEHGAALTGSGGIAPTVSTGAKSGSFGPAGRPALY
jgi:hypothetical protein